MILWLGFNQSGAVVSIPTAPLIRIHHESGWFVGGKVLCNFLGTKTLEEFPRRDNGDELERFERKEVVIARDYE